MERIGMSSSSSATRQRWLRIFLPFAVGYFFSYLLRNVNAVIAPDLARELGIGAADLGLLTSAYLLAFGGFQLPLGLLLDRFGPRRVEAALLLLACAGCVLFARGHGMAELTLARALIGLGVSACLMASFKAFALGFGTDRLPALNAAIMAAGGLGALTATEPLSAALPLLGWRGMFLALAALGLLAMLAVATTPDSRAAVQREPLADQLRGLRQVLSSAIFWRFGPLTAMASGGFMAVQGLWAVPWLMHFNGYSRELAARHLLLTSIAMVTGFVAIATLVDRLKRRGISPLALYRVGMGCGVLVLLSIVSDALPTPLLWFALGLVFSLSNLAYALLSAHFPLQLGGRANTALNLAAFVGAFALQWAFGAAVDAFNAAGWPPRDAYRATLLILVALQGAAYSWFLFSERLRKAAPAAV
jgi:predicted MFS family arabinose efflux permease